MTNQSFHKIKTLPYPVFIGRGIWKDAALLLGSLNEYRKFFFLTDTNVAVYCLPVITRLLPDLSDAPVYMIPAGESSKDISVVKKIWKWLMDRGAGRDALLINLGGGVVSDLGGFTAGTYKRGIRYVNVPTSLTGQADASVGGKTAVNIGSIKNQAGLFNDPSAVLIDPGLLQTLPERELVSGYAELIKSAFLSGGELWDMVRVHHAFHRDSIPEMIRHAVAFKCDVVLKDPREMGRRRILNFGHTIGHAFESFSQKNRHRKYLHGEAVAAGMVCEAYLSYLLAGLPIETLEELVMLIRSHFVLQPLPANHNRYLMKIMKYDKKNIAGDPRFVLMESEGKPVTDQLVHEDHIAASFDFYQQIVKS